MIDAIGFFDWMLFVLIFMCGIQLFYSLRIFIRLALYKEKKEFINDEFPVSIVICAKNEEKNLLKNLPFILNQKHMNFEVVVVNHGSTDQTAYVLSDFQKRNDNLKVVFLKNDKSGKKEPIALGIENASHEHLIFTDADCKPVSENWIKNFSSDFKKQKQLIIGYAPHNKNKGLLNYFIRFDTAMIGITYLSYALSKLGYMAVGRNMAYTKNLFNAVNGFESHKEIASGDDDLFVQNAIDKTNFGININSETYCFSDTSKSWKSWFLQKKRHQSASSKYKVINKALLGIYSASLILMWFSFVSLFLEGECRTISLGVFCFVLVIKWGIQGSAMLKIKERTFIYLFPFLELAQSIVMILIYCLRSEKQINKW